MGRDWTCMAFWTSSLAFRAAATSAGSGAWTCGGVAWCVLCACAGGGGRVFRRGDGVARPARSRAWAVVSHVPGGFAAARLGGLARRLHKRSTRAHYLGCGRRLGDVRGLLVVGHLRSGLGLDSFGSWSRQSVRASRYVELRCGSLRAGSVKSVKAYLSAEARPVKNKLAACRLASVLQAASALPAPALVQESSTSCWTGAWSFRR